MQAPHNEVFPLMIKMNHAWLESECRVRTSEKFMTTYGGRRSNVGKSNRTLDAGGWAASANELPAATGKRPQASSDRPRQQFKAHAPTRAWAKNITQMRPKKDGRILARVLDLSYSLVIYWSMNPKICDHLDINAALLTVSPIQAAEAM